MLKTTILLADDHTIIRNGLRALLSAEKDFEIVAEAKSGREALEMTIQLRPNVVVMDLSMPLLNGVQATRQIVAQCDFAKVIALSAYSDPVHVEGAVAAGVAGYVLKHSAAIDLINAIREVARGKAYFSPGISNQLRQAHPTKDSTNAPYLTMREAEVFQLIAEGFPNKGIASELNISIKTVEKHRQSLMNKLNLHCVADLARDAIARGVVEGGMPMSLGN
jgi:DNA-binding NarL/FixJ family response regulator